MNHIEQLKKLFNSPNLRWLQYFGGSGGEFLNLSVNKYSPLFYDYSSNSDNEFANYNVNRFKCPSPTILEPLTYGFEIIGGGVDELVNFLIEYHTQQDRDIDALISEFRNFIDLAEDKPLLIKVHPSGNSYFRGSSNYFISIDSISEFKFILFLVYTKMKQTLPYYDRYSRTVFQKRIINLKKGGLVIDNDFLDKLLFDSEKYDTFHAAVFFAINPFSINHIKNIPYFLESEGYYLDYLYQLISNQSPDNMEVMLQYLKFSIGMSNNTKIQFSKFTDAGYLEEFFKITDDNFRKDVLDWQAKNLNLFENQVKSL